MRRTCAVVAVVGQLHMGLSRTGEGGFEEEEEDTRELQSAAQLAGRAVQPGKNSRDFRTLCNIFYHSFYTLASQIYYLENLDHSGFFLRFWLDSYYVEVTQAAIGLSCRSTEL